LLIIIAVFMFLHLATDPTFKTLLVQGWIYIIYFWQNCQAKQTYGKI